MSSDREVRSHHQFFAKPLAGRRCISASVALTFPGVSRDLIDDYQFDFADDCAGKFRRDSYASGGSAGVTAGTFTAGPGGGG